MKNEVVSYTKSIYSKTDISNLEGCSTKHDVAPPTNLANSKMNMKKVDEKSLFCNENIAIIEGHNKSDNKHIRNHDGDPLHAEKSLATL